MYGIFSNIDPKNHPVLKVNIPFVLGFPKMKGSQCSSCQDKNAMETLGGASNLGLEILRPDKLEISPFQVDKLVGNDQLDKVI